jgi:cytochrome c556
LAAFKTEAVVIIEAGLIVWSHNKKEMFMKRKIAIILLIAGLGSAPVALSHLDSTAFYQSYRQSLYALLGANFGPMESMLKGEMPWNQEMFINWSEDLARAASLDIMRGFPAGSDTGRTRAKPNIWNNIDDFESKIADLRRETTLMAEVAANGNKPAILKQFQKTGGTCKACHDEYKSKEYL